MILENDQSFIQRNIKLFLALHNFEEDSQIIHVYTNSMKTPSCVPCHAGYLFPYFLSVLFSQYPCPFRKNSNIIFKILKKLEDIKIESYWGDNICNKPEHDKRCLRVFIIGLNMLVWPMWQAFSLFLSPLNYIQTHTTKFPIVLWSFSFLYFFSVPISPDWPVPIYMISSALVFPVLYLVNSNIMFCQGPFWCH